MRKMRLPRTAFVYFVYFVVPTALPHGLGRIVARWGERAKAPPIVGQRRLNRLPCQVGEARDRGYNCGSAQPAAPALAGWRGRADYQQG